MIHRVLELYDDCLPKRPREKVYWFSRHPLTSEQEIAIYYLHGKSVRIEFIQRQYFTSAEYLADLVESYSQEGLVYVVAPMPMIVKVKCDRPELTFRFLYGYVDGHDNYHLVSVKQVSGGFHKEIVTVGELEKFEAREGLTVVR